MDDQRRLSEALRAAEDLRAELGNAHAEQISDARRRAQLYADELLTCALTVAHLEGRGLAGVELDIALDWVRSRAEEVGLLQRRPPRPVT